jgi:hypothetical protein
VFLSVGRRRVRLGVDGHVGTSTLSLCAARDRERGARGGRLVGEAAIGRISARCATVVIPQAAAVRVMHAQCPRAL